MKKILWLCALVFGVLETQAQSNFQVQGDFDATWRDCVPWTSKGNTSKQGTQPQGWTISNVRSGSLAKTTVGSQGKDGDNLYVVLTNKSILGNTVPAYMSLGTTWATAKGNATSQSNQDGGTFGGMSFSYHPDAVRMMYQRNNSNGAENACLIAYLWKGTWTQADVPGSTEVVLFGSPSEPTKVNMVNRERNILDIATTLGGSVAKSNDAALIAKVEKYLPEAKSEWTECIAELDYGEYTGQDITVEMLNIIISANDYFGERTAIVGDNSLSVDDVTLLYYHALKSLSYEGVTLNFNENTLNYDLSAQGIVYDASKLSYVKKGQGATVKTNYDEATGLLTLRVEAENISEDASAYTEYTVQFAVPVITSFTNALTVGINGATSIPQETEIQLVKEVDGSYSFALNNFMLGELGIGNVRLTNLTVNGNVFTAEQTIQITEGDAEGVGYWMGPMLGDVPVVLKATRLSDTEMVADIDIDMSATLEQVIKVVFAPLVEINDTEDMPVLSGLYNVKLNRMFVAGWNTVCLPFNYQVEAFSEYSGVEAQAFDSATEAGLNFVAVEDGVLAANTPYLINFPSATTMPVYFGVNIESTTPQSVTHGDFTFTGTYAAVTDMAGKYGVAKINDEDKITKGAAGSTLKATRAYFTTSGADVQSVSLFFDGEATGIEAVETTGEKAFDVYTISGVQVRRAVKTLDGLQKGIYIVNGKKQVVK